MSHSPAAVQCRPFQPDDLRALYAIEEACFKPPLRFSRTLMRSLAYDPNCRTWLGELDSIRAGFAILSLRNDADTSSLPDTATNPSHAYIWTIEVLPAFRRRGVARALLLCLEQSARAAERAAVELHVSQRNSDGLALYAAAGYTQIGIEPAYYGPGEAAFRYRKHLS